MALAALSPWPTTPAALNAARMCLRNAIGTPGLSAERTDALGSTAAAIVERYAPAAPQAVKNEAVIRLAGWLRSSPPGDLVPTGAGGLEFTWRPAGRNALRNSGAAGLLAPWHRPRAMVLEASS